MKKFTCLLLMLAAISLVDSQNCYYNYYYTTDQYSFYNRINSYVSNTFNQYWYAATKDSTTCFPAGTNSCCDPANLKSVVAIETSRVKKAIVDFGSNVARIGQMWSKISTLVNAPDLDATLANSSLEDRSGVSVAKFKEWSQYSPAQIQQDFLGFKEQASLCMDGYIDAIHKTICYGCKQDFTYNNPGPAIAGNGIITITQESCNFMVESCNKVWGFMHRFGWLVQAVALLNKRKDGAVTYVPDAKVYSPGFYTDANETPVAGGAEEVDVAVKNCNPSPGNVYCTDSLKTILCRSFIGIWQNRDENVVGRSSITFIKSPYNPASSINRRNLVQANLAGVIQVGTSGIDLTPANTNSVTLATPIELLASETSTWSSGLAGGSTSGGSSTYYGYGHSSKASFYIASFVASIVACLMLN